MLRAAQAAGFDVLRRGEEDIVAFHRRFLTITRETGLHRNTIRARLAAGGVTPFAEGGKDFGLVYLREEAERAIPELRRGSSADRPGDHAVSGRLRVPFDPPRTPVATEP